MQIKFFHTDTERFIKRLEASTIAKNLRTFDLLALFDCELKMPHCKKRDQGLFELRIRGVQDVRFFYVFQKDTVVIVLHGFIKKTGKIPKKELILANNRKKQIDTI